MTWKKTNATPAQASRDQRGNRPNDRDGDSGDKEYAGQIAQLTTQLARELVPVTHAHRVAHGETKAHQQRQYKRAQAGDEDGGTHPGGPADPSRQHQFGTAGLLLGAQSKHGRHCEPGRNHCHEQEDVAKERVDDRLFGVGGGADHPGDVGIRGDQVRVVGITAP